MRKSFIYILAIVAVLLNACVQPESPATSFSLDPTALQLKVGDMTTIDIVGTATNVEWISTNDSVASVFHGVVTANAIGYAEINAKSGNFTATCIVYVTGTDGATLRLAPVIASVEPGATYQMRYGNTYNLELTWTSSDETVATVDQNGLVTAIKPGNTTITLATPMEKVTALVAVKHKWGEYKLVWSDEFDGTSLDESVWNYNTGGGGWGNRELQHYTTRSENIRVEDGFLKIEARKEEYGGNQYTSGRIYSKGKKYFLYGKFEARIKFPGGRGTWPAYWMMGNSGGWPACGEIDIIEHIGSNPNRASFALHTPDKNGTKGNNWSKVHYFDESLADDFHTYAVEWAQEEEEGRDVIRFFVDDVMYAEQWETNIDKASSWPFNKPHYIIFNLAIGGNMGGSVDDNIFDQERIMYVDYVRAYQREEL